MSMRLKIYHNKKRSIASQKIDSIRESCRNSTIQQDYIKESYKPLLLQSYQKYTKQKNKTHRERLFQDVREQNKPTKSMSRVYTSRVTNKMAVSADNKNQSKTMENWKSTNLTENKSMIMPFFSTECVSERRPKTRQAESRIRYFKSTEVFVDPIVKFLKDVYQQKTTDLKISVNNKQQQMFVQRLRKEVNQKQIKIIQCDLGYRSICVITKNLLSNQIFRNIKKLYLDRNKLSDRGSIHLSQVLINCQTLQELSLVSVDMGNAGATNIFLSIQGHRCLNYLNLSSDDGKNRNRIGPLPIKTLKNVLRHKQCRLTSIFLANTCIGSQGFIHLCQGLDGYPNQIKQLCLSNNQIRIKAQDEIKIRSKLENSMINKLLIDNNNLGDVGAHFFAYLLGIAYGKSQISKSMYYIDLSANKIGSKGLQYLSMSLSKNHKLLQLYLAHNNLSEGQSFYTIRYLLTHNWTLSKLSLKKSLHESDCIKIIGEGLEANKSLYWLDLSDNKFCDSSFVSLFESLSKNLTLRILKLDNCALNDENIEKAFDFMQINKCLQSISLYNNYVNNKGAKALLRLIMNNRKICELYLKRNCINIHILKQIAYQLKQNTDGVMDSGDPDIKYFENAKKMQERHRENLLQAINNLQKKSQAALTENVIIKIVQKQLKITECSQLIKSEDIKIKILEQKLRDKAEIAKESDNIN